MKAVRLVRTGQPLELHDLPVPEPGPGEVLVRVEAAGICHSDAHYRAGLSPAGPLPLTLGHEVAGVVERAGSEVRGLQAGERVCLHYMVTCGSCAYCHMGREQFCAHGEMIGKSRPGGYAEFICLPARGVFKLPEEIPFAQGAIMMCSAATSYHALRRARLRAGESVAVFGVGGLGLSAVQLARAMGASRVFGVDLKPEKLALAAEFGALPVHAGQVDPVEHIRGQTGGRGVDVALELVGLPGTMRQAIESLAVFGRAALAGLSAEPVQVDAYRELVCREAELVGVADHLASEIPALIEFVRSGALDLSRVVARTIPLEAGAVNQAFDQLQAYSPAGRVVIAPAGAG